MNDNFNSATETLITYGKEDTLIIESELPDNPNDKNTLLGMISSPN